MTQKTPNTTDAMQQLTVMELVREAASEGGIGMTEAAEYAAKLVGRKKPFCLAVAYRWTQSGALEFFSSGGARRTTRSAIQRMVARETSERRDSLKVPGVPPGG